MAVIRGLMNGNSTPTTQEPSTSITASLGVIFTLWNSQYTGMNISAAMWMVDAARHHTRYRRNWRLRA